MYSWFCSRGLFRALCPPLRGVRGAAGPAGPVRGAALQGELDMGSALGLCGVAEGHSVAPALSLQLDQCLQEDFPIYKSFRFKGSIGPLRLHLVRPGSFTQLREALGSPTPMPRVLHKEQLLWLVQGSVIS